MGHEVAVTSQGKKALVPGHEQLDVRTLPVLSPSFKQAHNTDILLMTVTMNPI